MTHKESHMPNAVPLNTRNLAGYAGDRFYYMPDLPGACWGVFDVRSGQEYKIPERKVPKHLVDPYTSGLIYTLQ